MLDICGDAGNSFTKNVELWPRYCHGWAMRAKLDSASKIEKFEKK